MITPVGRICGSGDVAGEVVVSEMSTTSSESLRRRVPNDGRAEKTQRLNVEFGISPSASLPPSTCSRHSISINRMESGY